MPNEGNGNGDKTDHGASSGNGPSWRWMELLFGGGIVAYAISASVAVLWWAATVDGDVEGLKDADAGFERRLDKLDNIALGNRLTAVEVRIGTTERVLETIDRKLDRLLARRGPQDPG